MSEPTEMVERVAQAIEGELYDNVVVHHDNPSLLDANKVARAAIRAMLTPTREMIRRAEHIDALDDYFWEDRSGNRHNDYELTADGAAKVWKSMISSALGEE